MNNKLEKLLFAIFFIIFLIALFLILTNERGYEIAGVVKPITVLQYSAFLSFMFALELSKNVFSKISGRTLNLLTILGFLFILASLFEMLWSFGYWFSNYELTV